MRDKIRCPFHAEETPSCVLYEERYHCYGCGKNGPLSDLNLDLGPPKPRKPPTNLKARRDYIATLPTKEIRGIPLKYDDRGYYLVWPDSLYYKCRLFDPADGPKYANPTGHSQPLFWARRSWPATPVLLVVEGEINALSIKEALPEADVVSPGSAGDFLADKQRANLTLFSRYASIVVVVDRDAAGTAAAIHLKGMLLGKVPSINIVLMEKDANQVLVDHGKRQLREEIIRAGMPRGLPRPDYRS